MTERQGQAGVELHDAIEQIHDASRWPLHPRVELGDS